MSRYLKNPIKENRRLWNIYHGMKKRCLTPNCDRYKDYGGRGITICHDWLLSFDNFAVWAKENGYVAGLTIERKNVDGNYDPENCEWITLKQQARNKRETINVEYQGEKKTLIEWCEELCLEYDTMHDRIITRGWDIEKAFTTPSQQENSFLSMCKANGMNPSTVHDRVHKFGWSLEKALSTPCLGRGANSKSYNPEQFGYGKCVVCGSSFLRNSGKQIYCGERCRSITKRTSYKRTGLIYDGRTSRGMK